MQKSALRHISAAAAEVEAQNAPTEKPGPAKYLVEAEGAAKALEASPAVDSRPKV